MHQNKYILLLLFLIITSNVLAQQIPSEEEQIPYICTFSKNSDKHWGDDDFVQTFFFVIPESYKKPVYIRILDPETGGTIDENHGPFNSKTRFSIYGGNKAHSDPAAKNPDPTGNYKSGTLLATQTFSNEKNYDGKWYSFGPFNPIEGELQNDIGGRVLKVVIEGLEGDDGNLYRLFLSSNADENKPVEGGNGFAYEYCFRLADSKGSTSHLYPFVSQNVTAVKIKIFDFDNDGLIRVVSVAKKGDVNIPSVEGTWLESTHRISKPEINTSLDVQFVKQKDIKNNNIVVFISNQYGELMPFFTSPIGGIPKYAYKIGVKVED
ncbi:MAG: hypothetical protein K0S32_3203 [Bacteroidetes bacterium]|jgi:hypothetical protein|nr:hypothetical protein [Bacteroidota bacterium]